MNFSYWEHKHLLSEIDYVVVGMGLVGLQTGILLKEKNPSAKVFVVDRFAWSLGASTRNAGFACFANMSEILSDLKVESPELVYSTIKKRYGGLQKLRDKFTDEQIGYEATGSIELFTAQNKQALHDSLDSLRGINTILYNELGLDPVFTFSSKNTFHNTVGTIINQHEGQLHTGKLYSTILAYAQKIGVSLLGGLEVSGWSKSNVLNVNTTQGLELKCRHLILCTNAFSKTIAPVDVTPARGQVIVTEPLNTIPFDGPHFYDQGYYYWRNIDNRILLGGARNHDYNGEQTDWIAPNDKVLAELKRFLFEQILGREASIEYQWSGIMGMGSSNLKSPIVKEVEPSVIAGIRLGGMGVALSAEVAEEIVTLTT